MNRWKKKESLTGLLFILPSLLGVSIFLLIPFADVLRRSFFSAVGNHWQGVQNYLSVFSNRAFQIAAVNTLKFTFTCIPLLVIFSLVVGICLQSQNRRHFGPGRSRHLKTAFLMPMAVPVASVVLVWKLLFHNQGIFNHLLGGLGIEPVAWMETGTAFWVLVISYLWRNLGYDVVLWTAGLSSIPPEYNEAARVDGAGEWQCFRKITLPCLMPTLYTITVLSFLNSFKVFRESYLVAGDYPHESMYLMQNLFNNWFRELSFEKMSAGAVIVVLVIFGLTTLLRRAWEKDI